jgi:integrase
MSTDLIPVPAGGTLAAVAEAARDFAAASRADNTARAYRSDWSDFRSWGQTHGLEVLPAAPETVALYLADLSARAKPATIARRVASISAAHKAAGLDSPTGAASVRAVVRGIRRTKGTAQRRVAPVVTADLRRIVTALPETTAGLRDRALLLVGFAAALRRSELVALTVADVETVPEGLRLTIRRSKTDQEGEGVTLGIPFGARADTCPVRALRAYMEAGWVVSGPLFRSVDRSGTVGDGLSADSVADIIKRCVAAVGLDPETFSGHSLRAGFVTSAAQADVPEWRIARQSRHQSIPTLRRYVREASLFRGNAAGDVGL